MIILLFPVFAGIAEEFFEADARGEVDGGASVDPDGEFDDEVATEHNNG